MIRGASGQTSASAYNSSMAGAAGGGVGGGCGQNNSAGANGVSGGGGAGGFGRASGTNYAGGNGGDGYCWIEYIGTSQNFIIKTLDGASSNSAFINLSQYMNALNNKADKADGVPIGTMIPFTGNRNLPAGYLLCDGSAVSRTMYEDLFEVIGTTYGDGDGVETFNLPDLGFVSNSSFSFETPVPVIYGSSYSGTTHISNGAMGNQVNVVFNGSAYGTNSIKPPVEFGSQVGHSNASIPVGSNPIYADTSSLTPSSSVTVRYIIKAFNGMNTRGALLDLTGMANELNRKYDARTDFTIIYPNGGTAENPANVTINNRYVMSNPFPGYHVHCVVEVYHKGLWCDPQWLDAYTSNYNAYGVKASDMNDGTICVQTGETGVVSLTVRISGNGFYGNGDSHLTSAPCRIKVWKIGKIN